MLYSYYVSKLIQLKLLCSHTLLYSSPNSGGASVQHNSRQLAKTCRMFPSYIIINYYQELYTPAQLLDVTTTPPISDQKKEYICKLRKKLVTTRHCRADTMHTQYVCTYTLRIPMYTHARSLVSLVAVNLNRRGASERGGINRRFSNFARSRESITLRGLYVSRCARTVG